MATVTTGVKRKFHEVHEVGRVSRTTDHHHARQNPRSFPRGIDSASRSTSGSQSPSENESHARRHSRSFEPRASIVIIGVRGVGKSSLAVLASSAYSRRLIEVEKIFTEDTGVSSSTFRKLQGSTAFHERHTGIFKAALEDNSTDCVIVCSFSDLEKDGARLLREYSRAHPVIHVTRDLQGIQNHVQLWSEEKVAELVRVSAGMLRACTNFEFYNISEDMEKASPNSDHSGQPLTRLARGPFLTLKRAEHDFLRLLRNILGDNARHSSHHSVYPLSKVRLEDMQYASVVKLSAADIVAQRLDLDEVQTGVDAIELEICIGPSEKAPSGSRKSRLLDTMSEAFAILRRTTILPIITSVRYDTQTDRKHTQEADVTEHCLRLGPEYCKINLLSKDSLLTHWLGNRGRTVLIGSYNASTRFTHGWQDPQCTAIYERARDLGFDFIDISMPAHQSSDTFDALAFSNGLRGDRARISAYCTGKTGKTSLLLNPSLTPVSTNLHTDGHEGNVTASQRNHALFTCMIYSPLRFLIYGQNVSFSLSPAMHNAAYKASGMLHTYGTHSALSLGDFAQLVRKHDFGGAAIVQPFKTAAIRFLDQLSPQARAIGAVNTVIAIRDNETSDSKLNMAGVLPGRNQSGPVQSLYGDNTDWIGIRACIRRSLSPANTIRPHTTALVCGAGGMARAGIFALITLGVKSIFVCNRTREHAEDLSKHYNRLVRSADIVEASSVDTNDVHIEALESFTSAWPSRVRYPTIIVSCIPTQTADGKPTNFTIPSPWLQNPTAGVVVELAYMPVVTPVVLQVRALASKGWMLMDGLDVLPEQAFAQFELFTGRRAPRKLMRAEVFKHYNEDDMPLQGALNTDSPSHS